MKYKPGKSLVFLPSNIKELYDSHNVKIGYFTDNSDDGFYINYDANNDEVYIVLREDGIEYSIHKEEFKRLAQLKKG